MALIEVLDFLILEPRKIRTEIHPLRVGELPVAALDDHVADARALAPRLEPVAAMLPETSPPRSSGSVVLTETGWKGWNIFMTTSSRGKKSSSATLPFLLKFRIHG